MFCKAAVFAVIADSNQMLHSVVSDLGLSCYQNLQVWLISVLPVTG